MTAVLFNYPQNAAFGRVLPKNKIYEHAKPNTAVKELFVRQVEKIVWQYKLAPETINLKQSPTVPEIQIFKLVLKTGELKHDVLHCIDRAIPLPIIFELSYENKVRAIAAFKRPSDADSSKWVVGTYFESDWLPDGAERFPLPHVRNLEVLYAHLLTSLMPFPARPEESLQASAERMELIPSRQRELKKCETRLRKENNSIEKLK